jgi:hypothetical protein
MSKEYAEEEIEKVIVKEIDKLIEVVTNAK